MLACAHRRWDATPKVIAIIGALQLAMMAYGFQAPNMSKVVGSEWLLQCLSVLGRSAKLQACSRLVCAVLTCAPPANL